MLLTSLPLSQTVTPCRTPSPSSVTYFMDGPLNFVTFYLKFTIRSNSPNFPTEFHENSDIPGNSKREFRVA